MSQHTLAYKPDGAVLREFMRSTSYFRGLRGPVGSGKSVACCIEVFRLATQQAPGPDGIRRTRAVISRNTFPELKTTTIKTWLDWFPENVFGPIIWSSPITHRIVLGDVDLEVIFLALDKPADVKKVLSLELTFAWLNEAREQPKAIVDAITSRVGRYPAAKDGGPTWFGVIADTNSPDAEHWWPIMAGDTPAPEWMSEEDRRDLVAPAGWSFFTQPPAMLEELDPKTGVRTLRINPERENGKHVSDAYYERMVPGKARAWKNVYLLNRYDELFDGRAVYSSFSRDTHVAKERLEPFPGHPIYVGLDFGLTPAAVFIQHVRGRYFVLRELIGKNIGTNRFAPKLREFMARLPGFEFIIFGDPAGDQRAQTDEQTPFNILRKHDLIARPTSTNDPVIRIGAVEDALERMVDGQPGYLVSPCCSWIIRGKEGGYCYPENERAPKKNAYSHPADAEQYAFLGAGAGRGVVSSGKASVPTVARTGFSPRSLSGLRTGGFKPKGLR